MHFTNLFLAAAVSLLGYRPNIPQEPLPPEPTPPPLLQGDLVDLPIVMYHSVLEDAYTPYYSPNSFVISVEDLASDLAYLQEEGYSTVVMEEVIDFVLHQGDLPEKPIMLTFDDGYGDNYDHVLPLLEEYDMTAVVCLIGSFVEEDTSEMRLPFLRKEQVVEMAESGRVEFQCHTYDFHYTHGREGSLPLEGEEIEAYQQAFREDLQKNQALFQELALPLATTFSYPGGKITPANQEVVEEQYVASFVTLPRTNNIIRRGDASTLLNLSRSNRDKAIETEVFFQNFFSFYEN